MEETLPWDKNCYRRVFHREQSTAKLSKHKYFILSFNFVIFVQAGNQMTLKLQS